MPCQQADLDLHMSRSLDVDEVCECFEELENSAAQLDNDFVNFKRDTIDPVWSLRSVVFRNYNN